MDMDMDKDMDLDIMMRAAMAMPTLAALALLILRTAQILLVSLAQPLTTCPRRRTPGSCSKRRQRLTRRPLRSWIRSSNRSGKTLLLPWKSYLTSIL